MPTLDERIKLEKESLEQLKRQKRLQETRERKKNYAIDKARQHIIGKIVTEYFPEVLNFQPQRSNADNRIEFAPLATLLSLLADDKEYITQLKEKVNQAVNTGTSGDDFLPNV